MIARTEMREFNELRKKAKELTYQQRWTLIRLWIEETQHDGDWIGRADVDGRSGSALERRGLANVRQGERHHDYYREYRITYDGVKVAREAVRQMLQGRTPYVIGAGQRKPLHKALERLGHPVVVSNVKSALQLTDAFTPDAARKLATTYMEIYDCAVGGEYR